MVSVPLKAGASILFPCLFITNLHRCRKLFTTDSTDSHFSIRTNRNSAIDNPLANDKFTFFFLKVIFQAAQSGLQKQNFSRTTLSFTRYYLFLFIL